MGFDENLPPHFPDAVVFHPLPPFPIGIPVKVGDRGGLQSLNAATDEQLKRGMSVHQT
jgi:hypothetical protein